MIKNPLATILLFLVVTNNAYAFSISSWWQEKMWRPVLAFGGGDYFTSSIGQSQYFPIQEPVPDQFYNYSANQPNQTTGLYNGFLGIEWAIYPNWLAQVGLDYNQTSSFYANGSLAQGVEVDTQDIYSYRYDIVTRQLLFEGKFLYTYKQRYHPYILAGLGAAFNQASNYSTDVPPFLTFTRMYAANNTTSFSYAAGFGIDVDLNENLRFGIGYRFANLGQVQLGSANIDGISVSGTLSQSNLYANQLLAQLTLMM